MHASTSFFRDLFIVLYASFVSFVTTYGRILLLGDSSGPLCISCIKQVKRHVSAKQQELITNPMSSLHNSVGSFYWENERQERFSVFSPEIEYLGKVHVSVQRKWHNTSPNKQFEFRSFVNLQVMMTLSNILRGGCRQMEEFIFTAGSSLESPCSGQDKFRAGQCLHLTPSAEQQPDHGTHQCDTSVWSLATISRLRWKMTALGSEGLTWISGCRKASRETLSLSVRIYSDAVCI